jgi:hypothetical protein
MRYPDIYEAAFSLAPTTPTLTPPFKVGNPESGR